MSLIRKRRLTKQQSRRIAQQQKNQQQTHDSELLEGLVVAHYGKQLEVKVLSLPQTAQEKPPVVAGEPEPFWQPVQRDAIWRCHTRTNLPMLVTGDRVRWRADCNTGLGFIEALRERDNVITRPDRYQKIKPVAANVDLMLIVFAPTPVSSAQLIDRYLVMSEYAGITPLLVLNKKDLLSQTDPSQELLDEYAVLGYDTLLVSKQDVGTLKDMMLDKSVVFLGQSGVGKSSLINALNPDAMQRVNAISDASQLGQHTTTTTRLIPFLGSGALIDSPGIREYGLWHLSASDIQSGFVEMRELQGLCKFRNCKHQNEPQCALKDAVADGTVLARRFHSMLQLMDEVDTSSR